jgi:hypothetical protein
MGISDSILVFTAETRRTQRGEKGLGGFGLSVATVLIGGWRTTATNRITPRISLFSASSASLR